jgi:hypothetical protein
MTSPLDSCSVGKLDRKQLLDHLENCIESQRDAHGHLVAHLRSVVRQHLMMAPPPTVHPNITDCLRTLREIDKAYALNKQAEVVFETLISRLANGVF